jgi:hypothetical protein
MESIGMVILAIKGFPRDNTKVDIIFRTRYRKIKGIKESIPYGIWIEITGPSTSLKNAIRTFTNAARALAIFVSFCANAPIEDLQPELAFDNTPKLDEREFFQQFLLNEGLRPFMGRLVVIDSTGVGLGIMDMFIKENLYPVGITITGGSEVNRDGDNYKVPKRDLVTCLQILFQTERLKIARELKYVDTLVQELGNFRVKITTKGNDTYEAWREGQHDDLVLSVALACWYGENNQPNFMIVEEPLEEGVFEF